MPIYEYVCTSCGRAIDVLHGVSTPGPEVCEVCGGAMRKRMSAPAIHFKGSGWAKKDARDGARRSAGTKTDGGDSDGKSDGAAEKPAADGSKESSATAEGASTEKTPSKGTASDGAAKSPPTPAAPGPSASKD